MPVNLARMKRLRAGLPRAIDDGVKAGAGHIKDLGSQLAPKDTGDLSESGQVEQVAEGRYIVSFGNGLPDGRAVHQEYGTIYQPAQPYLTPAAQQIDVAAEVRRRIKDLR